MAGATGGDAAARYSATGRGDAFFGARPPERRRRGSTAAAPSDVGLSADAAREIESLRVELAEARLAVQIRDARVRALR